MKFSGKESVSELLLKNGADIDDADNFGKTPLSMAAAMGKSPFFLRFPIFVFLSYCMPFHRP